jgi:hypothetical protein
MEFGELLTIYGPLGMGWIFAWSKDRELTLMRKDMLENVRAEVQAKAMLQATLDKLVGLVEHLK